MSAVAVAEEADIVCSFIFKNRWAARNLDKICGQHSSQLNAIGVRPRHLGRTNATFIWYKVKMSPKVSERFRRPTLQTSVRRSREALLSPKVSLSYVILAISMSLAVDQAALIERQLNSQILPALRSNVDVNRPINMCGRSGSVLTGHRGDGNCPLNFTLSLSQKSLVQARGSNSSVQLSVTFISGVSAPVTLSAQGVPAGTEILFAPASARPSFSSTMTISTNEATPLDQFNITILAAGRGVEKSIVLSLLVVLIVHDVAIVSAAIQGTAVVGNIVVINATVANYGSVSEAFELRAYANTTLVADRSVPSLASEGVYASRLMWNTSGFFPGTYTVLVSVPPVQGELNLLDNSREAGRMILTRSPGSGPSPSPAASGSAQGLNYGRQLAIVAAIAEAAIVFLVVVRSKRKVPPGRASAGLGKI